MRIVHVFLRHIAVPLPGGLALRRLRKPTSLAGGLSCTGGDGTRTYIGHQDLRRELPTESQEAFEARVKRSAFSNLLQNEERLCLGAMTGYELGYDVGCKIYDGCLVRRKQQCKLPQRVITACEEHIEAVSGAFDRLT